ncbi:MAG: lipid II flippase MurJ [Chlamydiae bacterium]|nr:lipid II flippase MurJ [Chlamydiota bacterium]
MTDSALKQKREITKASQSFFSGTFMSRILGLGRDVLMAYTFGSSTAIAGLMVAFRLSNLLRRIFGEGALHAAFVPSFEKLKMESTSKSLQFFVDLSALLGMGLIFLTIVAEVIGIYLLKKEVFSTSSSQIVFLMLVLMPALFFICHAALCSSFLQCQGIYFLPAASPILFNIFWVLGVLLFGHLTSEKAVVPLAFFILMGLFFQWLSLFPSTLIHLNKGLQSRLKITLRGLKKSFLYFGKPFTLGLLGVCATQVNNALDALFGRFVDLQGPAYLWYAIRIEQVPVAIFGVALAGAFLPTFSRAYCEDKSQFNGLLDFSLVKSIGFLIPCTSALFFIGPATLNLIFSRGQFDVACALKTSQCLWAYILGLPFHGASLLLAAAFYPLGKYKITTLATVYSVTLNVLLNLLFAFVLNLGVWGIALATSFSSIFQCIFLVSKLKKEVPDLKLASSMRSVLIVTAISLLSGWLMAQCVLHFQPLFSLKSLLIFPREFSVQCFNFISQTTLFLTFLFTLSWLFKVREIVSLLGFIPFMRRWIKD